MTVFTIIISAVIILLLTVNIVLVFVKLKDKNNSEIKMRLLQISSDLTRNETSVRDEIARNRSEIQSALKENRSELSNSIDKMSANFSKNIQDFNNLQRQKFDELENRQNGIRRDTETKLQEIRTTVENKLSLIQEDNNRRLEEMRKTVDEKLQESVEKHFNESFKMINERLEAVHKGLGEMQTLAAGVGDLKKVLTNVKTRGTYGEIQLGIILEQFLSPEQYIKNAHPADDSSVVEYSIVLPGKTSDGEPVLLPVDSKFPIEDYQRLVDAYDNNQAAVENCAKQLENAVKLCARNISEKYIKPPKTTDFAILFVPAEGLYAEILRRPGFFEHLQHAYKVTVVGPTNLVAFLSSLQMGFRTLAIEQRSAEVWEVLGAVKIEFGKFNEVLEKVKRNLEGGIKNIDEAVGARSRAIERKLKTVQQLPQEKVVQLLEENTD